MKAYHRSDLEKHRTVALIALLIGRHGLGDGVFVMLAGAGFQFPEVVAGRRPDGAVADLGNGRPDICRTRPDGELVRRFQPVNSRRQTRLRVLA